MMRPVLLSILFLHLAGQLNAQLELIPNGGFEDVNKKVVTYDQFSHVADWSNATLAQSEAFDKSASAKTVGIPANDYGTMEPREGERYAGFMAWKADVRKNFDAMDANDAFVPGWNSLSDYLKCMLKAPLKEGTTYELVMHIALSGNSDRTINGIGAYFSTVDIQEPHLRMLQEIPQIFMEKPIEEKGKWIEVRERFKADEKAQYLIVGTFPYGGLEGKQVVEGADNRYAYYYIDGISLKEVVEGAE